MSRIISFKEFIRESSDDIPVITHKDPFEGAEVGEYTSAFPGSPNSAQRFAKHVKSKGGTVRIGRRGSDYYVYHKGAGPITKEQWRKETT